MPAPARDLSALMGSRICHDLISPIGAIGNGVELLQMSGGAQSPELALIAQSSDSANLRIRFFRVAFGASSPGQTIGENELRDILRPGANLGKVRVGWHPPGAQPRQQVKLALLVLQCFETAMPLGGLVDVQRDGDQWALTGTAERLDVNPPLWRLITGAPSNDDLTPAQVHFALIGPELARQGRRITLQQSDTRLRVQF